MLSLLKEFAVLLDLSKSEFCGVTTPAIGHVVMEAKAYGRALGRRSTRNPMSNTLAVLKTIPVTKAGAYEPNWS